MKLKNSDTSFGLIAIIFHWLSAAAAIFMLSTGFYMADLSFSAPQSMSLHAIHKSVGSIFFALILARLAWKGLNTRPEGLGTDLENLGAKLVHALIYIGFIAMFVSGYFAATLGGHSVEIFGLFSIPSLINAKEYWPIATGVHSITAIYILALIALHAAAALKHHFVDRNQVLLRMLGKSA